MEVSKGHAQAAAKLLELLKLEQIELNLYLGQNESRGGFRLFGGQVLAQATRAAYQTVADVHLHSLHGYFLRAGDAERPVLYEVERIRDGQSFSTRRVVAIQSGEAIFNMDVSFQKEELGFEHADPVPNVPLPVELEDDVEVALADAENTRISPFARRTRPFETRSVFKLGSEEAAAPRLFNPVWLRFPVETETTDIALRHCLLAYASDMGMVSTGNLPHQEEISRDALQMASLDHALWIHRRVPMGEWMLFHKRTSVAHGARAMVHAGFFSEAGQLIASVTQEGLVRPTRSDEQ
ncbi:MAG: acyl-CoA thioesterase II [Pseudomonadales bacterium]|nr:acyl-CoA thioesterase II [Pseudomonadales bacterium]